MKANQVALFLAILLVSAAAVKLRIPTNPQITTSNSALQLSCDNAVG